MGDTANRQLRARHQDLADLADRIGQRPGGGTARRLVQVYNGGSMGSSPDLFYLTHPVELDGSETEGGSYTPTEDTDQTIAVDVLWHAPSAGDLLTAYAVGGRWVAERGGPCTIKICVTCSGSSVGSGATVAVTGVGSYTTDDTGCVSFSATAGDYAVTITSAGNPDYSSTPHLSCGANSIEVCSTPCSPCGIPKTNLTLSWTNILSGNGSTTLTYNSGTQQWTASCVDEQSYEVLCESGEITLVITYYLSGTCPTGQSAECSSARANPFGLTQTSYTCSPFSITWTTDPDCPDVEGAGFIDFTVTT